MSIKYLPNTLSFLRLLLVIPFVFFFLSAKFKITFAIFIIAALTDALDGWIARYLNCQTQFGLIIDPLADKILIVSCFVLLGYHQVLPLWIVVIVLTRDLAITFGAFISLYILKKPHPLYPSLLSKFNTFLQLLLILSCLSHLTYYHLPQAYLHFLETLVTFTTVSSFLHYLWVWRQELKIKR